MPNLDPTSKATNTDWHDASYDALITTLEHSLNIDAGLDEVLTPATYSALTNKLQTALDTDHGLASIVSNSTDNESRVPTKSNATAPKTEPRDPVTTMLNVLPPAERLAVRTHPVLEALLIVRRLRYAEALCDEPTRSNDQIIDLQIKSIVEAIARWRVRLLGTSKMRTEVIDFRSWALIAASKFLNDTVKVNPLLAQRNRRHARQLVAAEIRDNGRYVQIELSGLVGRRRQTPSPENQPVLAEALTEINSHWRLPDPPRASLLRLMRMTVSPKTVTPLSAVAARASLDRLDTALNDFTTADLRNINLTDLELTNVRWTNATRWPQGALEQVERESVEIQPGLYVIRPGTNRDHALT